jgi:hypothetical protein
MALISDIRDALAARIDTIPGLRATAVVTGQVSVPVAIVRPAAGVFITYDETFDGAAAFVFDVTLLVSTASDRTAQALLDSYLSGTGSSSVLGCLQQDPTLGGVVSFSALISGSGYGNIDYSGVTYLGATLTVEAGGP